MPQKRRWVGNIQDDMKGKIYFWSWFIKRKNHKQGMLDSACIVCCVTYCYGILVMNVKQKTKQKPVDNPAICYWIDRRGKISPPNLQMGSFPKLILNVRRKHLNNQRESAKTIVLKCFPSKSEIGKYDKKKGRIQFRIAFIILRQIGLTHFPLCRLIVFI